MKTLVCEKDSEASAKRFASFFTVKVVVSFAAFSPLTLIVVVSNSVKTFVNWLFTGRVCWKIRAASARCLVVSGETSAADTQMT